MRILISITRFEPGKTLGSEVYLKCFLQSLSRIIGNEKIAIVGSTNGCRWGEKFAKNFEWIPKELPDSAISRMVYERKNIEKTALKWSADVVYFPFNIMPRISIPTVLLLHDLVNEFYIKKFPLYRPIYYRYVRRLVRSSIKKADAVITISEAIATELKEFKLINEKQKVSVIPLAVDRNKVKARKPAGVNFENKTIILQPGAQLPHKSHLTGIKAMVEVFKQYPQLFEKIVLVLTGQANKDEKLKRFIKENNLTNKVFFLGRLDAEELEWIMNRAAVVSFPTLYEGFGLGVVDAQLRETPVIGSDIKVMREVSGYAAILFAPENERDLADKLVTVLNLDGEQLGALKIKGTENVNKWNWLNHSEQVLKRLKETARK